MSKWSLNAKIYFVLSLFITASCVIAFIGQMKMEEIKDSMERVVKGSATRVGNSHELKELFFIQLINEKNFILEESDEGMNNQLKRMMTRDQEFKDKQKEAIKISTNAGKKDLAKLLEVYQEWWVLNSEMRALASSDKKIEAARLSMTKGREKRLKVEELLNSAILRNEDFMRQDVALAEENYTSSRNLVLIISLLSIAIGLTLATVILRNLNKAISNVISNLSDSSQQVTSAAEQIATAADELSTAATEQASSLEETSSSIEEMSSMVQKNADSAKRTSDLARSSSQSAENGKKVMQNMIHAISEISASNNTIQIQVDESNNDIAEIVKLIGEIGNKTKVINDIVFQTKLLSFNASVEAARAGENGKGFAVVAEEVGNLAQMSGNAAKEITEMLDNSIQKVQYIVLNTKEKVGHLIIDGKNKIDNGNQIAIQCGSVLEEIVENVSSVNAMADEISNACQEQSLGIQEITKAMGQLDQVTQINAATSEESASAANELSSQAHALYAAVGVLVGTINGANAAHVSHSKNVIPMRKSHAKLKVESEKIPSGNDARFG